MGRRRSKAAVEVKEDEMQLKVFEYFIIQIQKMFRGYYSRRYKKNHASRKKYLKDVTQKGEEVRRQLAEYARTVQEVTYCTSYDVC